MDKIRVTMKSSNTGLALEHLQVLRNCESDGGIGIMIEKIQQAMKK